MGTLPYPLPLSGTNSAEDRYLTAVTVPYTDAGCDDLVACMIGTVTSAKYTGQGTFNLTIDVPFDVIGDPTEFMRSQGDQLVIEFRKLMS